MALAAGDFVVKKRIPIAPGLWRIHGTYTGPASYTSGGEVLTNAICKAALGINAISQMEFEDAVDITNSLSLNLAFDHNRVAGTSQGKIRAFLAGGAGADGSAEMTATHNLSTYVARFIAHGA